MKNTKRAALLLLVVAFGSCKRQDEITPAHQNSIVTSKHSGALSNGDGRWDILGYGIDITKDMNDLDAPADAPIFDIARFAADHPNYIDVSTGTESISNYYYGKTALDYMTDVNNKKNFSASGGTKVEGATKDKDNGNYSLSFSYNTNNETKNTLSTAYSYATSETIQRVKRIRFTGDATLPMLMQYLTPEFVHNIDAMEPDSLIARYGTHVLMDISLGGCLRINFTGAILSQSNTETNSSGFKIALGAAVSKTIGINIGYDNSSQSVNQVLQTISDREYSTKFSGGSTSGTSINIDKDGNPSETFNIGAWQQSITPTNSVLIDVGRALYIYDFIADPTKKALVKTAVDKFIASKQITLFPQPIYGFYTNTYGRHAYDLNPNMDVLLASDGWQKAGQPFKAYSVPYNNAIPIYHYYNNTTRDHVFGTTPTVGIPGYTAGSIMFYAYRNPTPGTVPVYQFTISGGVDHYYSTSSTPFDHTWTLQGVAFYTFN